MDESVRFPSHRGDWDGDWSISIFVVIKFNNEVSRFRREMEEDGEWNILKISFFCDWTMFFLLSLYESMALRWSELCFCRSKR